MVYDFGSIIEFDDIFICLYRKCNTLNNYLLHLIKKKKA